MNVLAHDPLRVVYEALERAGCKPHGPHYKFTSRCPGHDDRERVARRSVSERTADA